MRTQEELYNQINELMKRKNGEILVNNLRKKINDKIIYNELSEEDVNAAFDRVFKKVETPKVEEEVKAEVLKEAVTFIDNAGNLKTTTAEEYNKQMHEYNTDTEIAKYKKSNKKEYNLLDEDIEMIKNFFELNTLNESVSELSEEDKNLWKVLFKSIDFIKDHAINKIFKGIYAEDLDRYSDIASLSLDRKREKLKNILSNLSIEKKKELLSTPEARRLKNNPIAKRIVGKVLSAEGGVMAGLSGATALAVGASITTASGSPIGMVIGLLYGAYMLILTALPSLIAGKILRGKYNSRADENAINAAEVVKALGKDKKIALAENYDIYNLLDL